MRRQNMTSDWIATARTLSQALPYLQRYTGAIIVVKFGGNAMVIANVNFVGEQQLEYYGRASTLVNAQLDVDSYVLNSGDSIGMGYGSKISYTSLNATDNAEEAVMAFVTDLADDIIDAGIK